MKTSKILSNFMLKKGEISSKRKTLVWIQRRSHFLLNFKISLHHKAIGFTQNVNGMSLSSLVKHTCFGYVAL
jgi:hypothetical protein